MIGRPFTMREERWRRSHLKDDSYLMDALGGRQESSCGTDARGASKTSYKQTGTTSERFSGPKYSA